MAQSVTPLSLQLRVCWWGALDFGVYIILFCGPYIVYVWCAEKNNIYYAGMTTVNIIHGILYIICRYINYKNVCFFLYLSSLNTQKQLGRFQ